MRTIATIILLITSLAVTGQNTNALKNAQQRDATKFMNELEKGDTAAAFARLAPNYAAGKKKMLPELSAAFSSDFQALSSSSKRHVVLVFPNNTNLFRFRYVDDTGIVLQVDISYEINPQSKITDLGLITTKSFKKQQATNRVSGYDFH